MKMKYIAAIAAAVTLTSCGTTAFYAMDLSPLDEPGSYVNYDNAEARQKLTAELHQQNMRLITSNPSYQLP